MKCFYCGRPAEAGTVLCASCRRGEDPAKQARIAARASRPAKVSGPGWDPPMWAIALVAAFVFGIVLVGGLWLTRVGQMLSAARAITQP